MISVCFASLPTTRLFVSHQRWPDQDATFTRDFERPGDVPVEADEKADQLSEEQARRAKVEQLLRGVDIAVESVWAVVFYLLVSWLEEEGELITASIPPPLQEAEGAPPREPDMPLWLTDDAAAAEEVERRLRVHVEHTYRVEAELQVKLGHSSSKLEPKRDEFDWQPDDVVVDDLSGAIDFEGLRARYWSEINIARNAALNRPGR